MSVSPLLNAAGRRRSPATLPGYLAGRPPRNEGIRYPADPPPVEEIVAVMHQAGDGVHGARARGLIVVLWRAGLRIQEALSLAEVDLDEQRGALLVRNGKGGKRREVGMDRWGFERLRPWLGHRTRLPVGPLFCIIGGPTSTCSSRVARGASGAWARRSSATPSVASGSAASTASDSASTRRATPGVSPLRARRDDARARLGGVRERPR